MLKLTIEDDEGKTTVIPVIRDEMTIGRQDGNTIRLTERNVSRRHARLLRQNGVVYLEDLASFTGVKLNGARISSVMPIREGDELHIGDYKIVLKSDRPAERSSAPHPSPGAISSSSPTPSTLVAPPLDPPTIPRLRAARIGTPAMGSRTTPAAEATAVTSITSPSMTAAPAMAAAAVARALAVEPSPHPAATPEPLDAQPTIPVRTLGERAAAQGAAPAPARLVVLSTELAGMEFTLGRASVVIGRTDENDVQLNHRSISRHHAKVVRDHDRYTIVDLQSANGVRVNGDDYERIELNPGDIVELGHVKMRFVGPFELYVFDPASAAKLAERKIPAKVVFTLAGVVFSVVGLIALQRLTSHRRPDVEAAVASASHENLPPAPTAAPAIAAPAPAPTPAPEEAQAGQPWPKDLLAKIARDSKSEDWGSALTTVHELNAGASAHPPLSPAERVEVAELFRKIETERKGSTAFAKFDEASGSKNYGGAIDWFEAIPADSLYKKRARPRYEEARALFVSEHLTAAEKFRNQGKCADMRREAEEVVKVDPANQLVKEVVKLCKSRPEPAVAVAAPSPRATRTKGSGAGGKEAAHTEPPSGAGRSASRESARGEALTSGRAVAAASVTDSGADAEGLMKQARDAWLHQQCGSAIDIARRALKAKPGLSDAYQIIAVCSCSLRDAEGASRAYNKLDERSRSLARSLCQKSGITLGGE